MIDGLKAYPSMKDSGVAWLGAVPGHWEVVPLGTLLRERRETNDDGRITHVLSVLRDRGVIPYAEKGNIGNKKSEDITRYKIVRPNDIVVNCMNVIIGSVGLSSYTGCLSPVYYVLVRRSHNDNPRYLNAYFQTKPFQRSLVRIGNGILAHRMRIPMELLKREPFPRPPAYEQAAIMRFLDHADRLIRRYVGAKRKLIRLLEEQKRTIIHQAVTRGLDPTVRLKPSGVEWLGDVPEHWMLVPLKFLSRRIQNGATPPSGDLSYYEDGSVPWFGPSSLGLSVELGEPVRHLTERAFESGKARLINPPAILVIVIGATAGRLALLRQKGSTNQQITAFEICETVASAEFVAFQARSTEQWLRKTASTATIPIIGSDTVERLLIALPPINEQQAIVEGARRQVSDIDAVISAARHEITLLQELHTHLIADVVTGKLDVRAAATALPEMAGEPEDFDAPSVVTDEEGLEEATEAEVEEAAA